MRYAPLALPILALSLTLMPPAFGATAQGEGPGRVTLRGADLPQLGDATRGEDPTRDALQALEALTPKLPPRALEGLRPRIVIPVGKAGPTGYGPLGATVRFTQERHGIPALGDRAIVQMGPGGEVYHITLTPLPPLKRPGKMLDLQEALRIAQGHYAIMGEVGGELVWEGLPTGPGNGDIRLSWRLHHREPMGRAFVTIIDAETGAFRGRREEGADAGPEALAYDLNPFLEEAPSSVTLPDLAEDGLTTARLSYWMCKDRQQTTSIEAADGEVYESHICNYIYPSTPDDGSFIFTPIPFPEDPARDEDDFVGPQLISSLTKGMDFMADLGVETLLGEPFFVVGNVRWANAIDEASLTDPTAPLAEVDNAYFSPPYTNQSGNLNPGTLSFGQGRLTDFGYDADVAIHELGHGLVHTLEGPRGLTFDEFGTSYEPSALNEAFADYVSSALQGDSIVGEYAALIWEPEGKGVRDLEERITCPDDMINQQHNDGQVFSGALWAVRQGVGSEAAQREMDLAVMAALAGMDATTNISQASEMVIASARALIGDGLADDLDAAFRDRGAIGCERIKSVAPKGLDEPVLSFTSVAGRGSFGTEQAVPAGLQLKIDLPEEPKSKTLRLRFVQGQYKGVPLNAFGYNRAPQEIIVLGKAGEAPIVSEISYDEETTHLDSDGELLGTALLNPDIEPIDGRTLTYPAYELEWELEKGTSGPYYIQIANMGRDSASAYNFALEIVETEGRFGCSTAPSTSSPEGGAGAWILLGILAVGARRRREEAL